MNFCDCLIKLTEWGLTLQEVLWDRTSMGLLQPRTQTNCTCIKAQKITKILIMAGKCLESILEETRSSIDENTMEELMDDLRSSICNLQDLLRTTLTIQITGASSEGTQKAKHIMRGVRDVPLFVKNLIASIAKLVEDLLVVAACKMFNDNHVPPTSSIMDQADEEHLRSRVEALMSDSSNLSDPMQDRNLFERKELGLNNLPFAVKSCPTNEVKRTPSVSPTPSPSKKPRRLSTSAPSTHSGRGIPAKSPVLKLLQSKKKGLRSGLYQWVLWREALKGEFGRSPGSHRGSSTLRERNRIFRNLNKSFTL